MQKLLVLGLLTTSIIFGMAPALAGDRDHKPNFRAEYRHNYHHDYRRIYRDNYRYDQRRDQYHDRRFHSHDYKHNKYRKHYGHPGRQKNMITIGEVPQMITSTLLAGQCC
ncbi:hypothetical protein [Porticoccus sp.]|uniref:hypothetical protein n=1 Tax=Porticoccus sp. TaxID=2024853 RepID=UPI000C592A06|nr:hypothetical protein [Porticoccus sp.]MAZ69924.1 hypothetical protein [Porticoccus sp.]|tara:strand:+ start:38525 stop:38854 length:330 start_codon:yes stop_codon:yes gene_type:complete